jgi:indole-3-acetate monooxygenase
LDGRVLARVYLSHLHAAETAAEVTSVAHRLGGGAAAYSSSPLLRALCDVEAARQHLQFAHKHRVALGRVLAGVDATYPPYIT